MKTRLQTFMILVLASIGSRAVALTVTTADVPKLTQVTYNAADNLPRNVTLSGPNRWEDRGTAYVEQGRDEWSLYLDDNRGTQLQLDLYQKKAIFSGAISGNFSITGISTTPVAQEKKLPPGFHFEPKGNIRGNQDKGIFFGSTVLHPGSDVQTTVTWLLARVKDSKGAWRPCMAQTFVGYSSGGVFLGDLGPEEIRSNKSLVLEYLHCDDPVKAGLHVEGDFGQNSAEIWTPWPEGQPFPANAICLGMMSILGKPAADVYVVRTGSGFGFVLKDKPDAKPSVFYRLHGDRQYWSSYDAAGLPLKWRAGAPNTIRVLTTGKP